PNRSANRHHGHLAGAELMMKALFLIDFGGVLHERAYTRIPLPAKELSPAYDLRNPPAPLLRCHYSPHPKIDSGYSASLPCPIPPSAQTEPRLPRGWTAQKSSCRRAELPMP